MTDDDLLEEVQKQSFWFFFNECNPENGLVRDRANNFFDDREMIGHRLTNCAGIGFGLTCICVADSRGWISRGDAYQRVLTTLKTFRDGPVENVNGFFYRYNDFYNCSRCNLPWGGKSELSSVDTALFLCGALYAGEYYKGTEIERIADELYRRVNWKWMCAGSSFVSMAWFPPGDPNSGFNIHFSGCWDVYCEGIVVNVLAIGSPTYPIDTDAWKALLRPRRNYKKYRLITLAQSPNAMFVHQYPNIWIDFRNKHDGFADYYENARLSALANREFCIEHMIGGEHPTYKTYGPDCWGLTSGDGPDGYQAYGSLPGRAYHDGTVNISAALGSMMFVPEESMAMLRYIYTHYKDKLWGRYGFSDSFNLDRNWIDKEVISIDLGPLILGIENYRTGMIWEKFMQIPYIQSFIDKCGFVNKEDSHG